MEESQVKSEEADALTEVPDKQTLLAVLQFLKKNNFGDTVEQLQKESKFKLEDDLKSSTVPQTSSEVTAALSAYKRFVL